MFQAKRETISLLSSEPEELPIEEDVLGPSEGSPSPEYPRPERKEGYVPYYQRIFEEALHTVAYDGEAHLLNKEEWGLLKRYDQMSVGAQRLLIRLFVRSRRWLKIDKELHYKEIDNVPLACAQLQAAGMAEKDAQDLHVLLKMASAEDLKRIIKQCHIPTGTANVTQPGRIQAILAYVSSQCVLFGSPTSILRKKLIGLIGPSIRLQQSVHDFLMRMMVVYFRSYDLYRHPMTSGVLQAVDKWVFPSYIVKRDPYLFPTRQSSIEYVEALKMDADLQATIDRHEEKEAAEMIPLVFAMWSSTMDAQSGLQTASTPLFNFNFTTARVYTSMLSNLARNVCPVLHEHAQAVQFLEALLARDSVRSSTRGKWWEALAHMVHNNIGDDKMKREEAALAVCIRAIRDRAVRGAYLMSIRRRLERIAPRLYERQMEAALLLVGTPKSSQKRKRKSKEADASGQWQAPKGSAKLRRQGWEDVMIPADIRHRLVDLTIKTWTTTTVFGKKRPDGLTGYKSRWFPPDNFEPLPTFLDEEEEEEEDLSLDEKEEKGEEEEEEDLELPSKPIIHRQVSLYHRSFSSWSTLLADPNESAGKAVEKKIKRSKRQMAEENAGLLTVEGVVLDHYRQEGWVGLHLENALIPHLFTLLFYDILFPTEESEGQHMVFQTRCQMAPLDLTTSTFWSAREEVLHHRLEEIRALSRSALAERLLAKDAQLREKHVRAVGLHWQSLPRAVMEQVSHCLEPKSVAGVCEAMGHAWGEWAGGLPDLALWRLPKENASAKTEKEEEGTERVTSIDHAVPAEKRPLGQLRLIEVKGPGDTLSEKQRCWLDLLCSLGWDVEVCHVRDQPE